MSQMFPKRLSNQLRSIHLLPLSCHVGGFQEFVIQNNLYGSIVESYPQYIPRYSATTGGDILVDGQWKPINTCSTGPRKA
jgi:hypothetical protein